MILEFQMWMKFCYLTRVIKQSKTRQVRRSQEHMFGYPIPRNYSEALEFDSQNNNSKWYDAMKNEMDSIKQYGVFQTGGEGCL